MAFTATFSDHAHAQLHRHALHVHTCLACSRRRLRPGTRRITEVSRQQVAGETEVKAQIKMRLTPTSGVPIVVIRSFQLQQKKSALQFKALDQVCSTARRHARLGLCITCVQGLRHWLALAHHHHAECVCDSRRNTWRRWLGLSPVCGVTTSPYVLCWYSRCVREPCRLRAQIMQTFNRDTGAKESISYRCTDMDRQVPHVMGVSKVRGRLMHGCRLCDNNIPSWPALDPVFGVISAAGRTSCDEGPLGTFSGTGQDSYPAQDKLSARDSRRLEVPCYSRLTRGVDSGLAVP